MALENEENVELKDFKYIYEPEEDSFLILKSVKSFVKSEHSVLEIGTGSGILANQASEVAKKVLAVDINKNAITLAKEKIIKNNLEFKTSNLFSNVSGKFDVIIFNPPYLPEDKREPEDVALATSGGKKGYELPIKFLEQVSDYLNPDGLVLLLISSLTNPEIINQKIKDLLLDFEVVGKTHVSFEDLFVYKITKNDFRKYLEQKKITRLTKLTHGHRGFIHTGYLKNSTDDFEKKVAIKSQRNDVAAMGTVNNEITQLKVLNSVNIGPKLLFSGDNFFVYEFVEGKFIIPSIETSCKKNIFLILNNVFEQMFVLDSKNLNKEEMHNPVKHVIVKPDCSITLLDFERCKYNIKVHNVTQFCQFISSVKLSEVLLLKDIIFDKDKLIDLAREYSSNVSRESFDAILKEVNK